MEVTRIEPFESNDARARRRNNDRLASLYESQSSAATRLAYLLTGDVHSAQDVAHEAFVKIGRKIFRLRDAEHERAYLYRTVVNVARGRGRRLKIERSALQRSDRGPTGDAQPPDVGEQDEVWQALLQLPVRQRAALFLRYYQDLSEAQAAETLECSVSAMKSLVNRGLRDLRARLEGERDE
jgi:RNA polymerase sigma factor (sigma-70 family)